MKKHFLTSALYTCVTAILLGIVYPAFVTGFAQLTMRNKADGQLITSNGATVGSALIGQPFTGPGYFHSRPSAAGTGYDASSSSGSNLAPTSKALADRLDASVKAESNVSPVPVDLVTTSASGLDPDITPAAALYQVGRVAENRHVEPVILRQLIGKATTPRQLGLFGEARVNVLRLNLALDNLTPQRPAR